MKGEREALQTVQSASPAPESKRLCEPGVNRDAEAHLSAWTTIPWIGNPGSAAGYCSADVVNHTSRSIPVEAAAGEGYDTLETQYITMLLCLGHGQSLSHHFCPSCCVSYSCSTINPQGAILLQCSWNTCLITDCEGCYMAACTMRSPEKSARLE